jgi:hypothetical protein
MTTQARSPQKLAPSDRVLPVPTSLPPHLLSMVARRQRSRLFVGQFAKQTDHEVAIELRERNIDVVIGVPRLALPSFGPFLVCPCTCSPLSLI